MDIVIMNIPIPKRKRLSLTYEPTTNFSIRAEWARSKYLYRIPGPLTDSMFYADPTQATRSTELFQSRYSCSFYYTELATCISNKIAAHYISSTGKKKQCTI